ncbi:MAG: hypothetical protein AUG51_06980 [Acidobacteria bacterium 13_1_20CM_3_53_8]|nr:MAG: hypothetical protein AUG51_06980 [Acidobacteria bacterium 13_1_20CM_3_53_8]
MSNASDLLDRINIPSPCQAEWDEMTGNDQVRFCVHCSKHVNNISEMTRKRALELVARSHGRLCIRYYRRPDGTTETLPDSPSRLYRIKRRASKIAAGTFSAALSLSSTAVAQTLTQPDQPVACRQTIQANNSSPQVMFGGSASLAGTVMDANGAVIPGANVALINETSGAQQSVTTDEYGQYNFQNLGTGSYSLSIFSNGFKSYFQRGLALHDGEAQRADASLEVGETVTMGGAMAVIASDPLIKAASENDLAAVKKLIEEGADVSKRDDETETTALDEAVMHGNRDMVRVLLGAGADVNARTKRKQTALMRLDEDGTAALVWDLVSAGARVNARDSDGDTPLIMAAQYSNLEVVRALISAGANVNATSHSGETALMAAAGADEVEIVEALFNAGANINARDHDGNTALKRAQENNYEEVIDYLKIHNALEDVTAVKLNN